MFFRASIRDVATSRILAINPTYPWLGDRIIELFCQGRHLHGEFSLLASRIGADTQCTSAEVLVPHEFLSF